MEIFFGWLVLAVGVGFLANSRGRNGFGYFLLSAVLSPLIGIIVVLVTEDLTKKQELAKAAERDHERRIEEVRAITSVAPPTKTAPLGSVADELAKLADLKVKGVLTEDEFAAQKALLLGKPASAAVPPASTVETKAQPVGPLGQCPRCDAHIPLNSEDCPKCNASFGFGSSWKVIEL